jgi:hypothetical protein
VVRATEKEGEIGKDKGRKKRGTEKYRNSMTMKEGEV